MAFFAAAKHCWVGVLGREEAARGVVRLGMTARGAAAAGVTRQTPNAFVDLGAVGGIVIEARHFAMVQGGSSIVQLASPLAGLICAHNAAVVPPHSAPFLAADPECVESSWLVQVDTDVADADALLAQLHQMVLDGADDEDPFEARLPAPPASGDAT